MSAWDEKQDVTVPYPQEAMDKATTTIRRQALLIAELEARAKLLAQENGETHEVRRQQAERIERLESALRKISTTPNRPFPDPNAHSWDAYHRAVFVAWSSANQMARAALTTAAPEFPPPPRPTTCNPHPDAPHGFLRNESHSEDRYVCECEYWIAPEGPKETP